MTEPSLWALVAQRYRESRDLRAGNVTGRFDVRFESATLVIRKSNGVERAVDFDEFRAAWRTMAAGAEDATLRLVTANGPYLRTIREDLIGAGVAPDKEVDGSAADDLSTAERHLLDQATRRSRATIVVEVPPGSPTGVSEVPGGTDVAPETAIAVKLAALEAQLAAEQNDKESALRDNARLVASIETLEERLRFEANRATELEGAVANFKAQSAPRPVTTGSHSDVPSTLARIATAMVKESQAPAELQEAASTAIRLIQQDPPSAVTKARVVTELLVREEWSQTFGADPGETRKLFGDYARELDGQPGVDAKLLAVKRTLYRVASPGAHELIISPRRAALVVLVLAALLDAYKPRR